MKLRLFIATLLVSVGLSTLAQAQNKIIVIRDDGTREEIDLTDIPPEPPVNVPLPVPTRTTPSPSSLTAEDLISPLDLEQPALSTTQERAPVKMAPAPRSAKPAVRQAKPKATAPTPKKKAQAPYPPQKPSAEEMARAMNAKPRINHIDPRNIPQGTPITRALAVRAALEVAPASRGFEVFPTIYQDRPAFQVRFRTDNGPHDVIVDGESGKVLKN